MSYKIYSYKIYTRYIYPNSVQLKQCLSSTCWESNLNDKHRQNKQTKKLHIQPANQPRRKYVCLCISICTSLSLSPSLSLLIYIYVLPNIPQHQLTKQFLPFCFTSLSSRHVLSPANMFEQYVLLNYLCL